MSDETHEAILKRVRNRQSNASAKYNQDSKERLTKIATTKIKTTMIGALFVIEKHFGFLWGLDENGKDTGEILSPEEEHMKNLFEEIIRSEILDLGNSQMRNMTAEIQQYEVEWKRYHLQLPVRPEGPKHE